MIPGRALAQRRETFLDAVCRDPQKACEEKSDIVLESLDDGLTKELTEDNYNATEFCNYTTWLNDLSWIRQISENYSLDFELPLDDIFQKYAMLALRSIQM